MLYIEVLEKFSARCLKPKKKPLYVLMSLLYHMDPKSHKEVDDSASLVRQVHLWWDQVVSQDITSLLPVRLLST